MGEGEKCPSTDDWIVKTWRTHSGALFSCKEEGNLHTSDKWMEPAHMILRGCLRFRKAIAEWILLPNLQM